MVFKTLTVNISLQLFRLQHFYVIHTPHRHQ